MMDELILAQPSTINLCLTRAVDFQCNIIEFQQTSMSKIIILLVFFALQLALPSFACLDSAQLPGHCTDCSSLQILYLSDCYAKQRGCMVQLGNLCTSCQTGYEFNNGSNSTCLRLALVGNITDPSIPPVTINGTVALTKISLINDTTFTALNDYFINKYSTPNNSLLPVDYSYLNTSNGVVWTILYKANGTQEEVEATAFVADGNTTSIEEWVFQSQPAVNNASLVINIDQYIRSVYPNLLNSSSQLIKVELVQKNLLLFTYLSGTALSKCLVEKNPLKVWVDLSSASSFVSISNVMSYLSKIFTVFSTLQNVTYTYQISKVNQTILFQVDFPSIGKMNVSEDISKNNTLSLSGFASALGNTVFSTVNQVANLNNSTLSSATQLNPVKPPTSTNVTTQNTTSNGTQVIVVQIYDYTPLLPTSPGYQTIISMLIGIYPQLSDCQAKAEKKNAQNIYRFNFTSILRDIYIANITLLLSNYTLQSITMNGLDISPGVGVSSLNISSLASNTQYQSAIKYFTLKTKDSSVPLYPIRLYNSTVYSQFTVNISTVSTSKQTVLKFYSIFNVTQIAAYLINQTESYLIGKQPALKNSSQILAFLSTWNISSFGVSFSSWYVAFPCPTYNTYLLKVLGLKGLSYVVLTDSAATLSVDSNTVVSTQICQELDLISPAPQLALAIGYAKKNYPQVTNFSDLQVAQIKVGSLQATMRLLYSSLGSNQVEFIFSLNGSNNALKLKTVNYVSQNFSVLNLTAFSSSTKAADTTLYNQFITINSTMMKNYSSFLFSSKVVLAKFDGEQFLVYYTTSSLVYLCTYHTINSTSTISLFISKDNINPLVLCTQFQYDQILRDYLCSSCPYGFNPDGKYCFAKITGCLAQAGKTCILCQKDSVLDAGACDRDCGVTF